MVEKVIPLLLLLSTFCLKTNAEIISSILNTIDKCIPNEKFVNVNFMVGNLFNSDEMTNLVYEYFHRNETQIWYKNPF